MAEGLLQYKCPCCGGAIEFDPSLQKVKCPYCDTEFDFNTLKQYDESLSKVKPEDMKWQKEAGSEWTEDEASGMRVYVCKSCGGSIVADQNTAATTCPYCGNPLVMMGNLGGDLKPDYIIPFRFDKEAAKKQYREFLSTKRLLPSVFKDENHIDEIKGVYVPFWLFDTDVDAQFRFKGEKVSVRQDNQFEYRDHSYYNVSRAGDLKFSHVPVDGSKQMDDALMQSIEPFDFSKAVPFQTAYLAGFMADRYDVSKEDSIDAANKRIKESIRQAFMETVSGYSSAVPISESIQLKNGKSNYALYPVWLLNTTWNGQRYTFAMNGETGKFVGNLPVDEKAYKKLWWKVFLIASVAAYAASWLIYLL